MKKTVLIALFVLGFFSFGFAQKQPQSSPSTTKKEATIRYFPNPATTNINFEFINNGFKTGYSIIVYNLMGKEVMNIKKLSVFTNVSLQPLYRGMYVFKLLDEKGRMLETGKFQVVK